MVRLASIRLLEAFFRAPLFYFLPALLMGILGVAMLVGEKPNFITVATIYIQPNETLASITTGENFNELPFINLSEIAAAEINGLIQSEVFLNEVLQKIDLSQPEYAISAMASGNQRQLWRYLQENTTAYVAGELQVDVVLMNESPDLAVDFGKELFTAYVDHKIQTRLQDTRESSRLIQDILAQERRQIVAIEQEYEAYLASHPAPQTLGLNRPDIEEEQIARLQQALDAAYQRYNEALGEADSLQRIESSTENVIQQTYLLIDAPFDPFELTSTREKLKNLAQYVLLGGAAGFLLLVAVALLNRRLLLPIDVVNGLGLPVLALVQYDHLHGRRRRASWRRYLTFFFPRSGSRGPHTRPAAQGSTPAGNGWPAPEKS